MANKIALVTCGRQIEPIAVGIFSPGHLLKLDNAGKSLKHATEGGFTLCLFAEEDALQGKTVADAYAVGDVTTARFYQRGDVVNALLKAGVSYAKGDQLISAGDGTLKKASAVTSGVTVKQIVGEIRDALDLSASGAVAAKTAVLVY